jgi:hypothetical protein
MLALSKNLSSSAEISSSVVVFDYTYMSIYQKPSAVV